jgi:hypothetical protein
MQKGRRESVTDHKMPFMIYHQNIISVNGKIKTHVRKVSRGWAF